MDETEAPDFLAGGIHEPLDNQFYYYQTKSGTVSKTPLSVRQLIRLLCPVRDGLNAILSPTTHCLSVVKGSRQVQNEEEGSYGEWRAANQIDFLREASCTNWYWTADGSSPEGPVSCRKLLHVVSNPGGTENEKIMVFAQGITSEWKRVSDMKNLLLVLTALREQSRTETSLEDRTKDDSDERMEETATKKMGTKDGGQDIQLELEAFLSSATGTGGALEEKKKLEGTEDHMYESDGGTRYLKDPLSGNWVHEGLAPHNISSKNNKKEPMSSSATAILSDAAKKPPAKKSKKPKFSKKNAKLWIYISGLPTKGITEEDLKGYFSKAGMLDLDPETLQPKVKLYRDHSTGELKGDASIRYARPESVELALQVLDNSLWDQDHRIRVERAKFSAANEKSNVASTDSNNDGGNHKHLKRKRPISEAQRKVARLALLQAQDDGFGGRLAGGRKGLCIIVVKKMMNGIPDGELEDVLHETFQKFGTIQKITCISKTQVVIVKFVEPIAASTAIQALNGTPNPRTKETMEAIYWDGVTDYTTIEGDEQKEREDEERRHEEFGNWLESQDELPAEFQLKVAKD